MNVNKLIKKDWTKGKQRFFTSDLHFLHGNIIEFCKRPFKDINEMTNVITRNWNKKVGKEDDIYIAGDLSMLGDEKANKLVSIMRRLNGKKHLIYGNHDRIKPFRYINDLCIESVHFPYLKLDNGWIIVHDPVLAVACPKDSVVIAGHVHTMYGKVIPNELGMNIFNVGVDAWDFTPASEEELKVILCQNQSTLEV